VPGWHHRRVSSAADPERRHRTEVLERSGFELEFDEDFRAPALDRRRWVAHYLPQWTTPARSEARYELRPGLLRLRIEADQLAWRLDDGEMRVSNLQTATFSGPRGSAVGQHRHRGDLTVTTPQPTQRLYAPTYGLFEAVMRATADPTCMLAFWLVGFEEGAPENSGEICVTELFGHAIARDRCRARVGVKAHNDPRLYDDMAEVALAIDATDWHTYSAAWTPHRIGFYVDDHLVRTVAQRINYPLQLMVDLFEFPKPGDRDPVAYPKIADVRAVRGYRCT
jgi:glycosyl hydrolase family 16